ncbi:pentapeptide repeat-containing protein, partial [Anabaena sp. CCY 9613]
MTEPQTPEAKDIKTSGGNYNEQIGKHYIHAETVNIYETAPNLSEPSKHNGKVIASQKQLAFAIAGSVNEVDQSKLKAILALLQKISGDASIEIIRVEEGSIRIILNGSDEGLERINELFESGELTEVLGTAVEYVELTELDEKSRLIQDIFHNGASSQNLSNADLSGADLSYANLSGANLIIADLSRANLSRANLSRANLIIANLIIANLISADLSGANLISANLSGADLSGADLSGANLSGANLSGANLSGA